MQTTTNAAPTTPRIASSSFFHGHGTAITGDTMSTEAALDLAGLNWRVRKEPMIVQAPQWQDADEQIAVDEEGNLVTNRVLAPTGFFGIVREDTRDLLGCVGKDFSPLQNVEAFAICDDLAAGGARWESAGMAKGGREVFGTMLLSDDDRGSAIAGEEDRIVWRLFFRNMHDGQGSAAVALISFRLSCRNQFSPILAGTNRRAFKFRHTSTVADRFATAAEILKAARHSITDFEETARSLQGVRMSKDAQLDFLRRSLGIATDVDVDELHGRKRSKLDEAIRRLEGPTCNAMLGRTAWSAFNAVTEMTTHSERVTRRAGDDRFSDQVDGNLAKTSRRAWNMATALV